VIKFTPILLLLALMSFLPAVTVHAKDGAPLTMVTPDKRYVTATQGPGEAHSIGSYALRLYRNQVSGDPTQDFIAGIVRPRDGDLLRLDWQNVTPGNTGELVVVTQSVGSGGYLSADAFQLGNANIVLVASVSGLPPDTDLIGALKKAAGKQ
jgi:hypothetical protein